MKEDSIKNLFYPGDLVEGVRSNLDTFKAGVVIRYHDKEELEDLCLLTNETVFLNGKWLEVLVGGEMWVVNEIWCKKYK